MGLAKKFRLHLKRDFEIVMRDGIYFKADDLSVKIFKTELNYNRFAIVINKKLAKLAVTRNRLKRRLREVLRKHLGVMKKPYDIIIFPRSTLVNLPLKDLETQLVLIFKKAHLL